MKLSIDVIFLFHLMGDYIMDEREKLMTQVRKETYKLYEEEKESHRYLRQKVRDLV